MKFDRGKKIRPDCVVNEHNGLDTAANHEFPGKVLDRNKGRSGRKSLWPARNYIAYKKKKKKKKKEGKGRVLII
jgi:hypothetical protein